MKKHVLLSLLVLSSICKYTAVYAEEGQKDDEEIYCDAVNQQSVEDSSAAESSSVGESSSTKGQ
jgi:hypothetical protein